MSWHLNSWDWCNSVKSSRTSSTLPFSKGFSEINASKSILAYPCCSCEFRFPVLDPSLIAKMPVSILGNGRPFECPKAELEIEFRVLIISIFVFYHLTDEFKPFSWLIDASASLAISRDQSAKVSSSCVGSACLMVYIDEFFRTPWFRVDEMVKCCACVITLYARLIVSRNRTLSK